MNIDSKNVEDYRWIKTQGPKKVAIKFSKRKHANKVRTEKKKLKGKNLASLGMNKPIYINDSLWAKCKKLRDNQVIHAFWISNGSIKLKVSETGNVHTVTHDVDLEELFPGNSFIEDVRRI